MAVNVVSLIFGFIHYFERGTTAFAWAENAGRERGLSEEPR